MTLTIATETVPLVIDVDGVIRVGKTRVTLDTVISAFLDGATAEEIIHQYPSLDLADVYSVIAYYLRRRTEIEAYLQRRREQAKKIRQQNESRFDPTGIRERLLARRATGKSMPGVFEVSRQVAIGVAIEDILLIAECGLEGEWEGQGRYLPLR